MHRVAFYPCCAGDFREPEEALRGLVDEIVFCDIRIRPPKHARHDVSEPILTFVRKDAVEAIREIPRIDVLFYRRDSTGEGGSGVFILGSRVLPMILAKMVADHCLIITDGSNSRGGTFRRMTRRSGFRTSGKHIKLRETQRFEAMGLLEFDVLALSETASG